LAGFEVTLYGRFWVTPEGKRNSTAHSYVEQHQIDESPKFGLVRFFAERWGIRFPGAGLER
jgi:hypothetical protein